MMSGPGASTPGAAEFGPAREDDLETLAAIDRESPQAWNEAAFAAELGHTPPTLFVLRASGAPVAFAVVRLQVPDMDIVNLAVATERRGRGFARRLLSSLLDQAASCGVQSVFLEVREGNEKARRLYASAGFEETQRRPGFYREPREDAILMRLAMSHETGLKGPRNAC
jgi:ribosomal-protein-alanine N-acetyltransferase